MSVYAIDSGGVCSKTHLVEVVLIEEMFVANSTEIVVVDQMAAEGFFTIIINLAATTYAMPCRSLLMFP